MIRARASILAMFGAIELARMQQMAAGRMEFFEEAELAKQTPKPVYDAMAAEAEAIEKAELKRARRRARNLRNSSS